MGKVVFTTGKEEKKKGIGKTKAGGSGVMDGKATVKPGVTTGESATVKHSPPPCL